MRVDIYRRAEHDGVFSYLAVPEGRHIPPEATGTDWQVEAQALEMTDAADAVPGYSIGQPEQQIAAKGYAITCLKDMGTLASPHD